MEVCYLGVPLYLEYKQDDVDNLIKIIQIRVLVIIVIQYA